jgi:glycosyltransferase involved in cell wall biosynthesis
MHALVAGARAMLMPSFEEGFGIPVIEALSVGVPVICSDIVAHREVGGAAPDYLDPLDGLGWMQMINAYSRADSPERTAQMARIETWLAPRWSDYFDIITRLLDDVTACAFA